METKHEVRPRCELPKIICKKTTCNPTKEWFDDRFQEILLTLEAHKLLTPKPKKNE